MSKYNQFSAQVDPNAQPVVRAAYRVAKAHEHHMGREGDSPSCQSLILLEKIYV
jgi:hypothetical protein